MRRANGCCDNRVNLRGFFSVTRQAIAAMLRNNGTRRGHVVNICTSLAEHANTAVPSALASLTKGGLNAVTRSLAIEYAATEGEMMEFLVDMVTTVPDGTTDTEVDAIRAREAARSRELAAQGHLLRLWRPPLGAGEWRTWGLFQAADAAELESVLSSMPLRVWRHDTVTPLTAHPSDPDSGDVMSNKASPYEADMLDAVLSRWKAAVDAHQPERVAELFTTDAIFQGLHPYTVGPTGVAEYYAAQPTGMTAAYTLRETRALSGGLVLGYLTVDFDFSDRATLTIYLSVIIRQDAGGWRIVHYQVSRLD